MQDLKVLRPPQVVQNDASAESVASQREWHSGILDDDYNLLLNDFAKDFQGTLTQVNRGMGSDTVVSRWVLQTMYCTVSQVKVPSHCHG